MRIILKLLLFYLSVLYFLYRLMLLVRWVAMFKDYFYKFFFSSFVCAITFLYFHLLDKFFVKLLNVIQPENKIIVGVIVVLSLFLRNPIFKKFFKKRMRETCLISFMTYRLNFEIYRFK